MYGFFFRHFLRNPKDVGAIVPLSKSVADQLIKPLLQRSSKEAWKILEVGAGTGSVTRAIIERMNAKDSLDVIEIDEACSAYLQENFSTKKNVSVHCLSIFDWKPHYKYDFIVSTLPLNSFSPQLVTQLLKHYQQMSTKGALCTYVEYIGLESLSLVFATKNKRKVIHQRRKILSNFHSQHLLEKKRIYTNFLPCNVFCMRLHEIQK